MAQDAAVGVLLLLGQAIRVPKYEFADRLEGARSHAVPAERVLGEEFGGLGDNAAQPESLHESVAYAFRIGRIRVIVRRDQGAQEVTKSNVDRWAIIELSFTDRKQTRGGTLFPYTTLFR